MKEQALQIPLGEGHSAYGRLREHDHAPLVILVHGLAGNMNEHLHYNLPRYLDDNHYSSFRFNLYGDEPDARQLSDCTTSIHAHDLDNIVRFFRERTDNEQHIAVVGHSLGGLTAILMQEPVNAMVLLDPTSTAIPGVLDNLEYVDTLDAYRWRLRIDIVLSRPMIDELHALDGEELLRKRAVPVKVISAAEEGRPQLMRRYYEIANEPKAFAVIDDSDHPFTLGDSAENVFDETIDWIRRFT